MENQEIKHLVIVGTPYGKTINKIRELIQDFIEDHEIELFAQDHKSLEKYGNLLNYKNVHTFTDREKFDLYKKMQYVLYKPEDKVIFIFDSFNGLDKKRVEGLFSLTQPNMKLITLEQHYDLFKLRNIQTLESETLS